MNVTQKNTQNCGKTRDICGLNGFNEEKKVNIIKLSDVLNKLTKTEREKIVSQYDMKSFARVFEDAEAMRTVEAFLASGLNISSASRNLYMHRNTLMYRLNAIRRQTGLDLRNIDMAVTFEILHILYLSK